MRIIVGMLMAGWMMAGCGMEMAGASGAAEPDSTSRDARSVEESVAENARAQSSGERVREARERFGEYYANRLRIFLDDTPQREASGIVFLGNSITQGFPIETAFPDRPVINRGIGGDKIAGVLARLDVSVTELHPSKVYVMIGTNNILWPAGQTPGEMMDQYEALLAQLKKCAPEAEIVVVSVPPMSGRFAESNPRVKAFNASVRPLVEAKGLRFVDLFSWMTDSSGELADLYTVDGVHFSTEGYQAWLEAVLPFEEFMEAASNLAPLSRETRSPAFPLTATNPKPPYSYPGGRGPGQLLVYTPAYGQETTGTNEWGLEAVVRNGRVEKVEGNNNPVPDNGFVISGHGKALTWIRSNLQPGVEVELGETEVRVGEVPTERMPPDARLRRLLADALDRLEQIKAGKTKTGNTLQAGEKPKADREAVRGGIRELHELRKAGKVPDSATLDRLAATFGD